MAYWMSDCQTTQIYFCKFTQFLSILLWNDKWVGLAACLLIEMIEVVFMKMHFSFDSFYWGVSTVNNFFKLGKSDDFEFEV